MTTRLGNLGRHSQNAKSRLKSNCCLKLHQYQKHPIVWHLLSLGNFKCSYKNYLTRDSSDKVTLRGEHPYCSWRRRMYHYACVLTTVSWTRSRSRTSIPFRGLTIFSINLGERWYFWKSICDQAIISSGSRSQISPRRLFKHVTGTMNFWLCHLD